MKKPPQFTQSSIFNPQLKKGPAWPPGLDFNPWPKAWELVAAHFDQLVRLRGVAERNIPDLH